MKGVVSKISKMCLSFLPMVALMIASASVESFCFYFAHQPDVPAELLNRTNDCKKIS